MVPLGKAELLASGAILSLFRSVTPAARPSGQLRNVVAGEERGSWRVQGGFAEKACSDTYLALSSRVCWGYGYGDTPEFG